jgi:DnaJ-class molecular chaperone
MLFLILRTLVIIGLIAVVLFVIKTLVFPSQPEDICSRCDGKGHWQGVRGRENCDWCNGSGRLN